MMRERRSKGLSATPWWTPTAGRSSCKPTRRQFRTATGPGRCCGHRGQDGRLSSLVMPTEGSRVADASPIRIEVVRKADDQGGFAVIARRWVIERFFAWINRNRRLAKDFETSIKSVEAFLYAASTMLL